MMGRFALFLTTLNKTIAFSDCPGTKLSLISWDEIEITLIDDYKSDTLIFSTDWLVFRSTSSSPTTKMKMTKARVKH